MKRLRRAWGLIRKAGAFRRLRLAAPILLKWAGMFALAMSVLTFAAVGWVLLVNGEFKDRGFEKVVLDDGRGANPVDVRFVIHKLLPEENAVEASVIVEAHGDSIEHLPAGKEACFLVEVDDRSPDRVLPPRSYPFTCEKSAGDNFISRQTPRFSVPVYQSVSAFPFDEIVLWPSVTLKAEGDRPPARYSAFRFAPGRVMYKTGDRLNWSLHLRRSLNQKILVLVGAAIFVGLTLLVGASLVRATSPPSGPQDLLALAGYILAAVGFRDLLGVTRTLGTSAFEIAVFILPFLWIVLCIALAHIRAALSEKSEASRSDPGRGAR